MKTRQITTRLVVAAAAVALILASCSVAAGPAPTSAPSGTVPTSTEATAAPSTAPATTGDFETAACGEVTGDLLCEAYELIRRHYVDPVDDQVLVSGALDGLSDLEVAPGGGVDICPLPTEAFVAVCDQIDEQGFDPASAEEAAVTGMILGALDRNSAYFNPSTLTMIEEEQSGEIEGIGALVATDEDGSDQPNSCQIVSETCRLEVVSTIEGGPAQAAGLESGDVFLTVDGEPIDGWTVDEVTATVRGPSGSTVDLGFRRGNSEFNVTIERAAIQVPVVSSEMVGDVAYLRLNIFTENADEQVQTELAELLANDPSALVLDLRDNPGGLLSTAVGVTSEFIDSGLVVSTESPDTTTPYKVQPGGLATSASLPMYIVVNRGSASASEVVAGALSDAGRATIVGENTYGKNTVQQRFPLSNGGAIKLTIARWLTPEGHDYGDNGLTPDVSVDLPQSLTVPEVVSAVIPSTKAA